TTAFVIGSPSFNAELRHAGLELLAGEAGRDAEIVAVGSHDGFNYEELRIATQAARRGARLYAAGRDPTFPMPDGPWPGTGAVLAAVEHATGATATVVGKPEAPLFETALERLGGEGRALVVGDRLDSDLGGAHAAGLDCAIVLTGA